MRRTALTAAAAATLALTGCDAGDDAVGLEDGNAEATPGEATPGEPTPGEPTPGEPTPEEPAPDEPAPQEALEEPEWAAPPDGEIGAPAALDPIMVEGDDVVVAVSTMVVYSTGAEVHVAVRTHPDAVDPEQDPGDDPMDLTGPGTGREGDDLLSLEFRYPDGRAATAGDDPQGGEEPGEPMLSHRMSSGRPGAHDYTLWLWPLPEEGEGPLEIVVDWPAEGIEEQTADIDLDALEAAADRRVELWSGTSTTE